jgi:hypothetical protein
MGYHIDNRLTKRSLSPLLEGTPIRYLNIDISTQIAIFKDIFAQAYTVDLTLRQFSSINFKLGFEICATTFSIMTFSTTAVSIKVVTLSINDIQQKSAFMLSTVMVSVAI